MINENICIAPWEILRIQDNGECYFCTSAFQKKEFSLGNILHNSFEEIWNGNTAKNVRQSIINNSYDYCKTELCNISFKKEFCEQSKIFSTEFDNQNTESTDFPELICISFDYSCKQKCVFCRDSIKMMPPEQSEMYYNALKKVIFPIINHVKEIEISCLGEFLDSPLCKKIIQEIVQLNENIKFNIITNGINLSPKTLEKYGIYNKLKNVRISLHSASKKTYTKIFRKDYFDTVLNNIGEISKLKQQNKIDYFALMFVICSLNYKEIPNFIKLAEKYGAYPDFSILHYGPQTKYTKDKVNSGIFYPEHRKYNSFVRVLNKPEVIKYYSHMPQYLTELKPVSPFQIFKNNIKYLYYNLS